VCIGDAERDRFLAALGPNSNAVADALGKIDSARAEAGDPADRAMISAAVEAEIEGGHVGLNAIVFAELRPALLALVQGAAVAARAAAGGLGTRAAREAAFHAAVQLVEQGDYAAAARQYEELLEAAAADPDPHSVEALRIKFYYAGALAEQGEQAAAAAQYEAVVAGFTAKDGADAEHTLVAKRNYAGALHLLGRNAEAAALGREVLAARVARGQGSTRAALVVKEGLAVALQNLQERDDRGVRRGSTIDEAGRLFREAIEGFTALGGPRHQETLRAQGNYAALLSDQGRWQEAAELQRELVASMVMAFGVDHRSTVISKYNLATSLTELGPEHYEEVGQLLAAAAAGYEGVYGAEHPRTREVVAQLARVEILRSRRRR
jgi:tetratricopeptide (TPR) repeat protein